MDTQSTVRIAVYLFTTLANITILNQECVRSKSCKWHWRNCAKMVKSWALGAFPLLSRFLFLSNRQSEGLLLSAGFPKVQKLKLKHFWHRLSTFSMLSVSKGDSVIHGDIVFHLHHSILFFSHFEPEVEKFCF